MLGPRTGIVLCALALAGSGGCAPLGTAPRPMSLHEISNDHLLAIGETLEKQGHTFQAERTYRTLLARDPRADTAQQRLAALTSKRIDLHSTENVQLAQSAVPPAPAPLPSTAASAHIVPDIGGVEEEVASAGNAPSTADGRQDRAHAVAVSGAAPLMAPEPVQAPKAITPPEIVAVTAVEPATVAAPVEASAEEPPVASAAVDDAPIRDPGTSPGWRKRDPSGPPRLLPHEPAHPIAGLPERPFASPLPAREAHGILIRPAK